MIKYFRIMEEPFGENPNFGLVVRNYRGNLEVFRGGKWQFFNILERGMEDGYALKPISELEAEKTVGKKLHSGEEKFKETIDNAISKGKQIYDNMSLDEMLEAAKRGELK